MFYYKNWAIVVPMANEEDDFAPFVKMLNFVIDELNQGRVYFIVDKASNDKTCNVICYKTAIVKLLFPYRMNQS